MHIQNISIFKIIIYKQYQFQEEAKSFGIDDHEPVIQEPPPSATQRRRRGAVSAAVISEEDAASYVKKVC